VESTRDGTSESRDVGTKSPETGIFLLLDVLPHLFEVVNPVVAHADGADFALIVGFDQSLPSAFTSLSTSIWSMEEHKINVSKTSFFQSLLYLSFCILVAECASRNFAGEEDIFTFESRVEDSLAASSLIAICGCRIDLKSFSKALNLQLSGRSYPHMSVSSFECMFDNFFASICRTLRRVSDKTHEVDSSQAYVCQTYS
jgi:hypothetical protein